MSGSKSRTHTQKCWRTCVTGILAPQPPPVWFILVHANDPNCLQVKLSDVRTSSCNNRFWCQREAIDFDMKSPTTDLTIKICLMTVTCRAYLELRNWTALAKDASIIVPANCAQRGKVIPIYKHCPIPPPPFFLFFIKLLKKKKKKKGRGGIFDPDTNKEV